VQFLHDRRWKTLTQRIEARFDGLVGAARDHADWDAIYGVSSTLSA
jgi:hypothetical protein